MDPITIIAGASALMILILGFILFDKGENKATARVKTYAKHAGLDTGNRRSGLMGLLKTEETGSRRRQIEESLAEIEAKQRDRKRKFKTVKARLVQADLTINPQLFTIVTLSIGAVIGLVLFFLSGNIPVAAAGAFIFGFGLPRWMLNFLVKRRQKKFIDNFADAMDIIVRGIRTGLPLNDCLKIIAHESPAPVGPEFMRVVEGESVGVPLDSCLDRMYDRMPVPEVNFFATVLNIQRTTGGNLGEALENLSNVLRGRKLLTSKIKALSAEAKMSAMIIAALPLIVMALVSITSPEYMTELYHTPTGHRNLLFAAGLMVTGTMIMRKMINFKY